MFTNNLLSYNPISFQQATELDYTIEQPHALKEARYCIQAICLKLYIAEANSFNWKTKVCLAWTWQLFPGWV